MRRFAIRRQKTVVYIGLSLIVMGLLLKRLVELTLVPDARIESSTYLAIIYIFQFLVFSLGIFLLVKRPSVSIRMPGKTEIILLTVSVVATAVVLEIVARIWLNYLATPEQYDRYVLYTNINPADFAFEPHPYLGYYPTPNYHKGGTFHNSLGYRSEEITLQKPDNVYRIVALGGSTTYDVSIENNNETFTEQLEKLLNEEYGYRNVQVINAGVPGYNSWEMLINLEFRVLDLDPDMIILYEGTNDVHARLVEPSAYRGDDSGRRKVWQDPPLPIWERSTLLRILSRTANMTRQVSIDDFVSAPTYMSWPYEFRLAEYGADVGEILSMNPPIYFRRNYENMIAIAEEHSVVVLLATWAYSPWLNDYAANPDYQRGFEENNQVVREVADRQDVFLFDYAAVMPQDTKYWADGRHVNEAGALLKARLFSEYIDDQKLIVQ